MRTGHRNESRGIECGWRRSVVYGPLAFYYLRRSGLLAFWQTCYSSRQVSHCLIHHSNLVAMTNGLTDGLVKGMDDMTTTRLASKSGMTYSDTLAIHLHLNGKTHRTGYCLTKNVTFGL